MVANPGKINKPFACEETDTYSFNFDVSKTLEKATKRQAHLLVQWIPQKQKFYYSKFSKKKKKKKKNEFCKRMCHFFFSLALSESESCLEVFQV